MDLTQACDCNVTLEWYHSVTPHYNIVIYMEIQLNVLMYLTMHIVIHTGSCTTANDGLCDIICICSTISDTLC